MSKGFVKNTAIVSAYNGLGVVSSFAIDVSIAALFGLGSITDAFYVAATIPLLTYVIFNRVAEFALVPVFVSWHSISEEDIWKPFSILHNLTFVGLLAAVVPGLALSSTLFVAIAPGLTPSAHRLAAHLGRLLFLLIPLNGLVALYRAMLNSLEEFAASTSSHVVRNIVVLVFLGSALFRTRTIEKVATGYLYAGIVQCIVLLFFLYRKGFRYHLVLDISNSKVQAALRATVFPLVGFSINQSNEVIERLLASFLAPGNLSALVFGRRIIAAVVNVFLNSVSSAIMPSLSTHALREHIVAVQRTLDQGIKVILLIALPITAILVVLNQPLVQIAFLRGNVTEADVQLIASIVLLYSVALPFLGLNQLIIVPHYAFGDSRTPANHLLLMILVQLVLDIGLFLGFGLFGIPLASGITGVASVVRGVWLLRRRNLTVLRVGGLRVTGKLVIASVVMGSTMYLIYYRLLMALVDSSLWMQTSITALSMLCGTVVLIVACRLLQLRIGDFIAV